MSYPTAETPASGPKAFIEAGEAAGDDEHHIVVVERIFLLHALNEGCAHRDAGLMKQSERQGRGDRHHHLV